MKTHDQITTEQLTALRQLKQHLHTSRLQHGGFPCRMDWTKAIELVDQVLDET